MVQLRRNCKPLLRTVAHIPHATGDDHTEDAACDGGHNIADVADESGDRAPARRTLRRPTKQYGQQQATPPSSETVRARRELKPAKGTAPAPVPIEDGGNVDNEVQGNDLDDMRDPLSDSDSDLNSGAGTVAATSLDGASRTFKTPAQLGDSRPNCEAQFGKGQPRRPGKDSDHDSDSDLLPWAVPQKRIRTSGAIDYGSKGLNIHAVPQKKTYSRKKGPASSQESRKGGLASSQESRNKSSPLKKAEDLDQPGRKFRSARPYDPRIVGHNGDGQVRGFKAARGSGVGFDDPNSPSSYSVPPSLYDSEELADNSELTVITAPDSDPTLKCAICGLEVDPLLKQAFEDAYTRGRPMTYKWQQRFCRHHRQHTARRQWDERGYPQIDWNGLEARLRKHHQHLRAILTDSQSSRYRDELRDRVRGGTKTAAQSISAEVSGAASAGAGRRTSAGYYGPRGEKAMTDHILTHLSDDIRAQAAKDKLVAASGVAGGVSGFVHLVLVPELAEQLVRKDLNLDAVRARAVLEDSTELGELLNPELDERIDDVHVDTP